MTGADSEHEGGSPLQPSSGSRTGETNPSRAREEDTRAAAQALLVSASSFSGPLPPPDVLAAYERVLPGSADRIIRMAEDQGSHRRGLERQELAANIRTQSQGQWLAFVIALLVSAGGIYLLATGNGVSGLVALLTPLAGLVALFLVSRSRRADKEASSEALRALQQVRKRLTEDSRAEKEGTAAE